MKRRARGSFITVPNPGMYWMMRISVVLRRKAPRVAPRGLLSPPMRAAANP